MTDPNPTAPDISDFAPFPDFARECERKRVATKPQLAWWMRYRQTNGLLSSGAIVEKRVSPTGKRPLLYVNRPKFIAWLSTSDRAA